MPKKNWDKVANQEFYDMPADAQKQWADLRHRLGV
jgi:hypothetical protein